MFIKKKNPTSIPTPEDTTETYLGFHFLLQLMTKNRGLVVE